MASIPSLDRFQAQAIWEMSGYGNSASNATNKIEKNRRGGGVCLYFTGLAYGHDLLLGMLMMRLVLIAVFTSLAISPAGLSFAQANLIHDYEFNGTLNDQLGGPALTPLGGTLTGNHYAFNPNQGLSLTGALPSIDDYSIDMSFQFDTLTGYRKILDFKNLDLDTGLYNVNAGVTFYGTGITSGVALAPMTMARVVLTRDGVSDAVKVYVNGAEMLSFTDVASLADFTGPSGIAYFFRDDNSTSGGEASVGLVNQIRIYDGALTPAEVLALGGPKLVPEPASGVLFGAGLLGVLSYLRRRRTR